MQGSAWEQQCRCNEGNRSGQQSWYGSGSLWVGYGFNVMGTSTIIQMGVCMAQFACMGTMGYGFWGQQPQYDHGFGLWLQYTIVSYGYNSWV